jgi:type IV secretion system protein VirB5
MRMKHLLGAVALVMAGPAAAQMAVIDAKALVQLKSQIDQMKAQYQQLQKTYNAISHAPNAAVQGLGQQMNVDQFRNALPSTGAVGGMMGGGGQLTARGQQMLNQNRVYAPGGSDFQAREMARSATSIAGAQSMAADLYASSSARIAALRAIEGQLATAVDQKAVLDLTARVQTEQAYIQAQQVQAQSLALWQASQKRGEQQRRTEQRRQSIDGLIEQARVRGG